MLHYNSFLCNIPLQTLVNLTKVQTKKLQVCFYFKSKIEPTIASFAMACQTTTIAVECHIATISMQHVALKIVPVQHTMVKTHKHAKRSTNNVARFLSIYSET